MLRKTLLAVLFMLGLAGICSTGCGSSPATEPAAADGQTLTVTDLAGRKVTLRKPIERIVLMRSLCVYELATVLGEEIEEKLVGWDSSLETGDRDTYEKFVEQFPRLKEVTVLGDVLRDTVSVEAVLALKPDLVIMNTYMRERQSKGLERLEQAGVPLLYLKFDDPFRDPQQSLLLLGQVLGKQERAEAAVRWIDGELEKVFSRLEKIEGPMPSIYLEAATQGPGKYGNTFGSNDQGRVVNWGSVLAQLRCRNVAADAVSGMYGMGVIRPEFLLTENPEVIVLTGAHWTAFPDSLRLGYAADADEAQSVLREFTARPGWADLAAVEQGRVHGIHTRFGSHVMSFAAAQQIAQWLYPAEFAELDAEARLREFHEKFMPIDYRGTWIVTLESDGSRAAASE